MKITAVPFLLTTTFITLILAVAACAGPKTASQAINAERPLLDMEIPAAVETAFFAMG